ncbi:MAG: hypothetical protein ACTSW1_00205, partial [Candidatus Hodarchaeales archaeon]
IFSAIYRGVEVARTGQIIARSPPKVAVISKYLVMLGVWFGMVWDSFIEVWTMLIEELHLELPKIVIPSFFYLIYNSIIVPLSDFLSEIMPTLQFIPFLLLPIYFIFSASFKFMSVTLVTPKVRDKLSMFFLLISTVFVLIITNILGDIYELGIPDAPLRSLVFVESILVSAVGIFEYIEAVAFYSGFFFGIVYVIQKLRESRREKTSIEEFKPSVSSGDTL